MDARQQHEFEMMQQTVAHAIGKNEYPGVRSRAVRPLQFPPFGVTEEIDFGQFAFPCVTEHQLAQQQRRRKGRIVRVVPGFQNVQLIVNQQGDLDGNPFALDREEMRAATTLPRPPWGAGFDKTPGDPVYS